MNVTFLYSMEFIVDRVVVEVLLIIFASSKKTLILFCDASARCINETHQPKEATGQVNMLI